MGDRGFGVRDSGFGIRDSKILNLGASACPAEAFGEGGCLALLLCSGRPERRSRGGVTSVPRFL